MLTTLASACRDQEQTRVDYRRHDGPESGRKGVSMAWPYRASVIAHANAETTLTRLPQQLVVEPTDDNPCRVELTADTPQVLAAWLGMLGVDFEIENPEAHPELVEEVRLIAGRYDRARRA